MGLTKTLASIVLAGTVALGASFLPTNEAEAKIINVPVQFMGSSFQDYVDSAESGDTLNLYTPDNEYGTTSFAGDTLINNKNLTIEGNGRGFIRGAFTISGTSQVTVNNSFIVNGLGSAVSVLDSASLRGNNNTFGSSDKSVNYNSSGNLSLDKCTFEEPQSRPTTSVNLEQVVGDISITQSFFNNSHIGINIQNEAPLSNTSSDLEILYNTFVGNSQYEIIFNYFLEDTTGHIFGNNFEKGIVNQEFAPKIDFTSAPEPATLGLLTLGSLIGVLMSRKKK